jgi:hypothetical protein
MKDFEIVVAHYSEDLDWLLPVANDATIYGKGEAPQSTNFSPAINLPNIGRESHTYLHHIVENYDSLARISMFLQGGIYGNGNGDKPDHVGTSVIDEKRGIFGSGNEVAHTSINILKMKEMALNGCARLRIACRKSPLHTARTGK